MKELDKKNYDVSVVSPRYIYSFTVVDIKYSNAYIFHRNYFVFTPLLARLVTSFI